jgi:hypothetical protein
MQHAMRTYACREVKAAQFLTSALDGDENSVSLTGRFIPGENAPDDQ